MPDDLKPYCGVPLLLMKALYGYTFSGKFLYEEQEEFLISFGMQSTPMPALWRMHLPGGGVLMVLQYSDDFLIASTDPIIKNKFKTALSTRFEIEWKPHADWFLQARIRQDADGNISLDQHRYAKSVVGRYLPTASPTPSPTDLRKFASPLPTNMVWTKANSSKTKTDVVDLETEYGFRFIEAVGSLNFLSNTAYEELFAIRKACKHMHLPGRLHFQALLHLMHHLRCYSPQALTYYRDVTKSPLATMLQEAGHAAVDPSFVWFCDSSFADCDDSRSTGCHVGLLQGGLINFSSFVPNLIAASSCESETNTMTVAVMASRQSVMIYCDLLYGDQERPFTVHMFTNSSSGIAATRNQRVTSMSCHIARRWYCVRQARQAGHIQLLHIDGDKY